MVIPESGPGSKHDLTPPKEAEQSLPERPGDPGPGRSESPGRKREAEDAPQKYAAFYDLAPVGFLTFDNEGFINDLNLTAAGLMGFEKGSLLDKPFSAFVLPEFRNIFHRHVQETMGCALKQTCELVLEDRVGAAARVRLDSIAAREGGYPVIHAVLTDISEHERLKEEMQKARDELEQRMHGQTARITGHAGLPDFTGDSAQREDGAPFRIMEDGLDLTAHERAEAHLRQSQKMEAIGTLAGGIAHDFNNILAGIIGFTEIVLDDTPPDSPAHRRLKLVLKSAVRGRELVQQILTFSRKTGRERKPTILSTLITETLKLLRASLPVTIEISADIKAKDAVILANSAEVQQILMNLCTNAAHAMHEGGGTLSVALAYVDSVPALSLTQQLAPDAYVQLTVKDTGTGIDGEVMKRIFEPFFTTKGFGQGTGMGLAVVYGIVKSLNGDITVESTPGIGSTFRVFLPRVGANTLSTGPDVAEPPRGTERILFVDDEETLAELGRTMLGKLGYKVTAVTDSVEALKSFSKNPSRFDLVFTDHTMPEITGLELAEELLKIRPDIPIILCTGHSDSVSAQTAKLTGIKGFLMKPLVRNEAARAIRAVLDTGHT